MIAAVIGMGSIGRRHARNLSRRVEMINCVDHTDFDATGIECDTVRYQPEMIEAAIQQSDLVVISTPHALHLSQMRACVKYDKPFFVEKPIASTALGLEDLCREAEDRAIVNQIGYNLRFHPSVEEVKNLLKSNRIGKILHSSFEYGSYLPGWRPGKNYKENYAFSREDGGILLDDIHEIDLACHLLGDPSFVQCVTTNTHMLGILNEEIADIVLIRQTMCPATSIHMDYLQRVPTRRFKIVGTDGTIEADLVRYALAVRTPDGEEVFEQQHDTNLMYQKEIDHFLQAVADNRTDPTLSVRCGLKTLHIALLARKSGRIRHWEKV